MKAKFAGLGCVATLGPCAKEDIIYFLHKVWWPLIEIDYEGAEPDPELDKLIKPPTGCISDREQDVSGTSV